MELQITKKHIMYTLMAAAVLYSIWPWFGQGIPATDDFRGHLANFWKLKLSIETMHFPSFWMQELYSGYPIFQFYSIVPYFISIPFLFFFGIVASLKYSIMLSFVVAAISMYVASKMIFKDEDIAFVSTIAYTFFNYHFVNAGIRGAFNELWGYSLFPIVAALMIRALDNPTKKNIIFAALASATIMLTHVPTAYMVWLCFGLYFLYKIFVEKKIKKQSVISFSAIAIASILLVSFWLFPFRADMKYVNYAEEAGKNNEIKLFGSNSYDETSGRTFEEIFSRNFGRTANGTSFYIGWSLIALLLVSFLYKNTMTRFFAGVSVFFILAVLFHKVALLIPLLVMIVYKFRFLVLIGFALSMVAGASAKALINSFEIKKDAKYFALLAIALVVVIDFYPAANSYYWINQETENFINSPAEVDALKSLSNERGYFLVFSPLAQAAYQYHRKFEMGHDWEGFREGVVGAIQQNYTYAWSEFISGLKTANINRTIDASKLVGYFGVKYISLPCIQNFDKIYPIKYTNNAYCIYENPFFRPLIEARNGSVMDEKFNTEIVEFKVSAESQTPVLLKVSHFGTRWHAYVDGVETKITDAYPKYMQIVVPQGNHQITFKYKNTPLQIWTKIISITTLIVLIGLLLNLDEKIFNAKSKKQNKRKERK